MQSLELGRQISAYTGVIIHAGQDSSGNKVTYSAGDDTGYVLEFDCPIGTQQMANTILAGLKLRGATYQPYNAAKIKLDPSVEIGDNVVVNGANSVVLSMSTNHSHMMSSDIAAPFDEEVEHAFKYVPKATRQFTRESGYLRSRITQTENEIALEVERASNAEDILSSRLSLTESAIEAKVSKTGGTPSSFGWTLTDSDWSLYSNGNRVLRATSSGIEITGKIVATSGTIGGVTIENGTLKGITDTNIAQGGISGGSGGSIASGSITGGSGGNIASGGLTNWNMSSGIVSNLGYGAAYGLAISGSEAASAYYVNRLTVYTALALTGSFTWYASGATRTISLRNVTIDGQTISYLGWS